VAETHWGRKINSPWRTHLLARRVESEKKYKRPFKQIREGGEEIISYATLGREKTRKNTERT